MLPLRIDKEDYGKLVLIGSTLLVWFVIAILFEVYGYRATWELWKVPTAKDVFLDFQLIPGSAESFRQGFEPTISNPFDPAERIFNYPAFWRLFFYTGITTADTIWIGVTMIVLFFLAVLLLPERLSVAQAIGMLLVIFSPASMLLYERGNVDLIVFLICVMTLLAASHSSYWATALIMFGSIVKMYPFFGVTALLKEPRNKFLLLFAACFLVLVIYMIATWSSVEASWNLTMRGDRFSYGSNVFVTRYGVKIGKILQQWFPPQYSELLVKYGPLVIALLLLLVVAVLARRNPYRPVAGSERHFAAFRMGASIYVGTFLLGNNFDYRFAFLILVMPQLVEWTGSPNKRFRGAVWLSIFFVLVSCWHLWIAEIPLISVLQTERNITNFWLTLDETFNWMLFISLAYLLVASTPDWLKAPFRNLLPAKPYAYSTD